VEIRVVAPSRAVDTITLAGRIEPEIAVMLAAEQAGRITEMTAEKGDAVAAGQVLMRIDDRLWRARARSATIERDQAARDMKRWDALKASGAVSDSEYDSVQRRLALAEVAFTEAEVGVSQCEVRSPVAGVVDDRLVDEGEYANQGQAVFRVVKLDTVKLVVHVPERDVLHVAPGKALPFRTAVHGDREFSAEVAFVASQAGERSHTFRTEAFAGNADGALRAGMIAAVKLQRGVREDAIVVPLSAVVAEKGEHIVYVIEEGRAVRRVVEIGALTGHEAVLAGGLAPGEALVVAGHRSLRDGALVALTQDAGE
jgi:membrane fusion protein (multidrug efflux system)